MKLEDEIIGNISQKLPHIIKRKDVGELTGGLVAPKTLSNADSAGCGPSEKAVVACNVVYSKKSFIEWLEKYLFKRSKK